MYAEKIIIVILPLRETFGKGENKKIFARTEIFFFKGNREPENRFPVVMTADIHSDYRGRSIRRQSMTAASARVTERSAP